MNRGQNFSDGFCTKKFIVPLTMTFHFSFYSPVLFFFFSYELLGFCTIFHQDPQYLAPKYLQELLDVYNPNRSLRSSTDAIRLIFRLNLPLCNMKSYGLTSFSVCGPKLWNALPSELRVIEGLSIFKAKLKTHLFKAYFN